jgi:hypothetical protein
MRHENGVGQRHTAVLPAIAVLAGLAALGFGLAADYRWAIRLATVGIAILGVQVVLAAIRRAPRAEPAVPPGVLRSGVEPLEIVERPTPRDSRPLPDVPPGRLYQPEVLDEIVRQAVAAVQPSALARGHDLDVQIDLHGERVAGNARQLGQILVTLLADAVRSAEPAGAITVSARCEGGAAVLSIRNTGTGLGRDLTRVREIAAQHGGRLEVRLGDDGAERIITLPVLAQAA